MKIPNKNAEQQIIKTYLARTALVKGWVGTNINNNKWVAKPKTKAWLLS